LSVYNIISNNSAKVLASPKQISSLIKPKENRSPIKSSNLTQEGIPRLERPPRIEKKYESEVKKPKYQIEHPVQGKQLSYSSAKEKASKVPQEEKITCRMCPEHNKAMEIFCRDDKMKICSSCALFGSHKNHNVCSEEQLICEITGVAEKILEIFELMEVKGNERQSFPADLKAIIKKKKEETKNLLRDRFEVSLARDCIEFKLKKNFQTLGTLPSNQAKRGGV
jgi:hypothetical protein